MTSYVHRNARRGRLQLAIEVTTPEMDLLRALLVAELVAIERDTWRVTDRTYEAVAADWLAAFPPEASMIESIDSDPVLLALEEQTALTTAQEIAIAAIHTLDDRPLPGFLDAVRAEVGNDATIMADLISAAHRRWILGTSEQLRHPYDDVGVLLPVRIETLFDPPFSEHNPDSDLWQLSIRIVPDEASIVGDNRYLLPGEQDALIAFWTRVRQDGDVATAWLDGDDAGVAWNLLVQRVGAERAAYLIPAHLPIVDGDGVALGDIEGLPDREPPRRVGGLPDEIWITATYTADVDPVTNPDIGILVVDDSQLTIALPESQQEARAAWWVDWDAAVSAGLAGSFALPEGVNPETIASLFVYGIGSNEPAEHFAAKVESGEFSVVRLGAATNSVRGEPTAGSEIDAGAWREVARRRLDDRLTESVSLGTLAESQIRTHLFGALDRVPAFAPVQVPDDCRQSNRLAMALWPALWGRYLRDVWGFGNDANWLGLWALENLYPEGPLMPLRMADEPYGLLPTTAISAWQAEIPDDPSQARRFDVEMAVAHGAARLVDIVSTHTRAAGNVVGATSEQFITMLGRSAQTRRYGVRRFEQQEARLAPYNLSPAMRDEARTLTWELYRIAAELGGDVFESPDYLIDGYWHALHLPLVLPTRLMMIEEEGQDPRHLPLTQFLELLDQLDPTTSYECYDLAAIMSRLNCLDLAFAMRTLPDSLLIRLLLYACLITEVWQHNTLNTPQENELLGHQHGQALRVAKWYDREPWLRPDADPDTGQPYTGIEIPPDELTGMERAFRATLDCAAHRIDPWVTGFAWQRLQGANQSERRLHRMGIYGWVDGPFIGDPGPTEAGLLHTPSQAQTIAALVLRDKYLSAERSGEVNEAGENPWQMDITAAKVRLAQEIGDEVRLGFHLYEILGRKVEQIVGRHADVRVLRQHPDYAMYPERKDPRDVCNGKAALEGLLGSNPPIGLSANQLESLHLLDDALDTYADLLMADGISLLVQRETELAAATLDAAAGFSHPPSLKFIRTPPSGFQLETAVVSVLPFVTADDPTTGNHPIRIADASVAAAAVALVDGDWTWTVRDHGTGELIGTVTLAQLGFEPVDTIGLPADVLADLALLRLGVAGQVVEHPRALSLLQELIAAFGERPVIGRDVVDDRTLHPAIDEDILTDLNLRWTRLMIACEALENDLRTAANAADQADALRRALIWGVTPATVPEDRETLMALLSGGPVSPESTTPEALCMQAAGTLQKRRTDAGDPPASIPELSRAIATFASPNGRLAILGRWSTAELTSHTGMATGQPQPDLDEAWLTVVAATRAPLARLEALQLELDPALICWTNAPGDPWRTGPNNVIAANQRRRRENPEETLTTPRFAVSYGAPAVWEGGLVAAGMIDGFSEAVPMPQRNTSAAFGFNAPSSRPPQTILLAVPPVRGEELTDALVLRIVQETRALAIVRAGHLEQWQNAQAILPASWLQATGPPRVRLEPWPLFV